MSDWERAARNVFKEVHPQIKLDGCWFHFTQQICSKTQKLGLSQTFKSNHEVAKFTKQLMAIPFLPASLINPKFDFLQIPHEETIQLEKLRKHFLNH